MDLLVREIEKLVNVSQEGQLEIDPVVRTFLRRVKRDPAGVPIKLYPFTRKTVSDAEPEPVEIDPRVAFGRPVLAGRGVPTATPPRKSSRRPSAASSAAAKRLEQARFYLDESI